MSKLKYEGIAFNKEWVASFKNEKEFLEACNAEPKDDKGNVSSYKHWFEGDPKRTDKLKELYAIATGKKEAPATEPAAEPAK